MYHISHELKQSHEELIKNYAKILDELPDLPFDRLSVFRIYLSKTFHETCDHIRSGFIRIPAKLIVGFTLFLSLGVYILSYFFAKIPIAMKFLSHIILKDHIKSKLKEIQDYYAIQSAKIENNNQNKITIDWLDSACKRCQDLSATIDHTLFSIITKISSGIGVLSAIVKFLNSAELEASSGSQTSSGDLTGDALLGLMHIFLSLAFFPFIFKRKILLEYKIFQLENNLFTAMGKKKNKEFPTDLCIITIVVFIYGTTEIMTKGDLNYDIITTIIVLIGSILLFKERKLR